MIDTQPVLDGDIIPREAKKNDFAPELGGGNLLNFDPAKFGLNEQQIAGVKAFPLLVAIDAAFQPLPASEGGRAAI